MADTLKKIEVMRVTDPERAKRATDWSLWCNSNHDATQNGMIHALGLRRNPERGRTHIVFKDMEHVPTATKLKHKFRMLKCGVFCLKDVIRDLESAMGLESGEGQEYVDSLFADLDSTGRNLVPFLSLSLGEGVDPWLGSGECSIFSTFNRMNPHFRSN